MEEDRKNRFYDKWSKVRYENVSEKELEVLNKEYRKARYLEFDQYKDRGISLFSEVEALDVPLDSCLIDPKTCVEQEVTTNAVIEEMLSGLSERERQVIVLVAMAGYKVREAAKILDITERHVLRLKKSAQEKMRSYLAEEGVENYQQASDYLLKKF